MSLSDHVITATEAVESKTPLWTLKCVMRYHQNIAKKGTKFFGLAEEETPLHDKLIEEHKHVATKLRNTIKTLERMNYHGPNIRNATS